MRSARMTLLFAASLLAAAEVVSLWLLLRELGEQQGSRVRIAQEQAATLLPKIAPWVLGQVLVPGPVVDLVIEPFDLVRFPFQVRVA